MVSPDFPQISPDLPRFTKAGNYDFGSLLDPGKDEWYDANHASRDWAKKKGSKIPKDEMEIYKVPLANRSSLSAPV